MKRREALERLAWRNTHRDFRAKYDGVKHVLRMVEGVGTTGVPLSSFTDEQLIGMMSNADRELCKGVIG